LKDYFKEGLEKIKVSYKFLFHLAIKFSFIEDIFKKINKESP